MPRTDSAIKSSRQANERRVRLQPYKTHMKTMMRKLSEAVQAGNKEEAAKILPLVQKSIDMAAKKNLIHKKTASRKKSLVARQVAAK
jgi:small subunit ribosomal protein S20